MKKVLLVLVCLFGVQAFAGDMDSYGWDTVRFMNYERAKLGRPQLGATSGLVCSAQTHVGDIGGKKVCQTLPTDGSSVWDIPRRCGTAAYGILVGCGYPTAEAAVAGWLQRQDTATMLLDPKFRTVGVGMVNNYWVVFFGL